MNSVCLNGKILPAGKPVLMADDRGYRYGDGLFETMKMIRGRIVLESYHFERLFKGMTLLKIRKPALFTAKRLRSEIVSLCKKNKCEDLARIRLSVSRGNGGLYEDNLKTQYLLEATSVEESVNQINKSGLVIDIFSEAQKNCDKFSNTKSANFLPYVMAAQFARENKLNDCLLHNTKGRIADATIANIFLLKNNLVITPSLEEGCVAGVMRRFLVEKLRTSGYEMREGVVTKNDMETFDEAFLTNAVNGIRWIKRFREKNYANERTIEIYRKFIQPLYS